MEAACPRFPSCMYAMAMNAEFPLLQFIHIAKKKHASISSVQRLQPSFKTPFLTVASILGNAWNFDSGHSALHLYSLECFLNNNVYNLVNLSACLVFFNRLAVSMTPSLCK